VGGGGGGEKVVGRGVGAKGQEGRVEKGLESKLEGLLDGLRPPVTGTYCDLLKNVGLGWILG
jgi:hypothetical protein